MKKRVIPFLALAVIFTGVFGVSTAMGAYWWVHGHEGKIQHKNTTDYWAGDSFEYGWGLDIRQKSSTSNWVHFAVPSMGASNKVVKLIKVYFWTGSNDAWVSDIHIWNGPTRVKEFSGKWSNGTKMVTLDLGDFKAFPYGLGISVKINAGVEMASHSFKFYGAGANFVNK